MKISEFSAFCTQKVIHWLDVHAYSYDHWQLVAKETLDEENNTIKKAIPALAKKLESFHDKYKKAVVKEDNLLYELLHFAFDHVNWLQVAKTRYKYLDGQNPKDKV